MSCRKIVVKAEEFGSLDFAVATKIVSPRELFSLSGSALFCSVSPTGGRLLSSPSHPSHQ